MKIANILILCILFVFSPVAAQTIGNLSEDQSMEFDQRRLIVERVSESTGIKGLYWRLISKDANAWQVYKGPDDKIDYEEFFRITGYKEEAERARINLEEAYLKCGVGGVFSIAGITGMCYLKTVTHEERSQYLKWSTQSTVWEEITHPVFVPGAILAFLGGVMWYQGMTAKLQPGISYHTAVGIADEYNNRLISEIIN